MDCNLLYCDSSTDGKRSYHCQRDIIKDLNLELLFRTMSREDPLIQDKVRKVIMIPLTTPEEIQYRHAIIADFYEHTGVLNELYEYALRQQRTLNKYKEERQRNKTNSSKRSGEIIQTIAFMEQAQEELIGIRTVLNRNADSFKSKGLLNLTERLNEIPLKGIQDKIKDMNFFVTEGDVCYTFQFGGGLKIDNAIVNYCDPNPIRKNSKKKSSSAFQNLYMKYIKKNTIQLNTDEVLSQDVGYLKEYTVQHMLKMFGPYLQNMINFFEHFIEEIAFYMGTIKFMRRMSELSIPLSMPVPTDIGSKDTSFKNLFELSMAIYLQHKPVGNDLEFHDNKLTLITGANQGGKSTFLRSYGIAQIMMQCGLPVPASEFSAPIYSQVFTHFTRREDEQLNSGRLREELQRMSGMINAATSNCLFLLNESFASTTEKEGSRIADGILRAFYDKNITTMMVTHLYQLARSLYDEQLDHTTFLVAERREGGMRTFKMVPGEPSHTSYGTDLFKILEE